jgi:hypothetical protein
MRTKMAPSKPIKVNQVQGGICLEQKIPEKKDGLKRRRSDGFVKNL